MCPLVTYERLKTKFLALKVVAAAYKRLSLTKDFKHIDLIWKTGYRGEVAAYDRRSQPEVPLYLGFTFLFLHFCKERLSLLYLVRILEVRLHFRLLISKSCYLAIIE